VKSHDLLKSAQDLVQSGNGKPRQSNLLRATSTIYYSLFHSLARCCADMMIGGSSSERSKLAWQQVYRALEHGFCKNACKHGKLAHFPQEIQDFANAFVTLQEKRHKADYDPYEKTKKSTVLADISTAHTAIEGFEGRNLKDRRAFAAFVLFKQR